jgi:hypothetical protein
MKYKLIRRVHLQLIPLLLCILYCSCSQNHSLNIAKEEIENALIFSSNNKEELLKIIDNFKNDSLKLKAAVFLIKNMNQKGFYQFELVDKNGQKIDHDLFSTNYTEVEEIKRNYESKIKSPLFYVNQGFRYDVQHISSALLIENIDYAFQAWKLPWASHLNFEEFCELLLPYRLENEPLQKWRKITFEKNIQWIKAKMQGSNDLLKLCVLINDSLKKIYSYRHKEMSFFPGSLSMDQVNKFGGGRCADLNMAAAYLMRAVGVPVASEFTPYWGNSNYGGHSWLSVFYKKHYIPFNSAYDNPSIDSLPFKGAHLAKAFRRKYEMQKYNLGGSLEDSLTLPLIFKNREILDITAEYLPVSDISLKLLYTPSQCKYAYLGVLNGKFWKIVQCARIQNREANFKSMATNVLYAPLYLLNESLVMAGDPFLLNKNGTKQVMIANKLCKREVALTTKRINWIFQDELCHLVYWNGSDWLSCSISIKYDSNKKEISFENIPQDGLYRIINDSAVNANESNYGRPFLFNKTLNKMIDY